MPSGRRVPRAVVGVTTAALAASSLMLLATPSAVAAPSTAPTCNGSANIFDVHPDGTLWLYKHNAPATGAASWSGPTEIGTGWQGHTFAGTNGDLYHTTPNGQLDLLHYDLATHTWANGGVGTNIGAGGDWNSNVAPPSGSVPVVDSTGHIFMDQDDLTMYTYDPSGTGWEGDDLPSSDLGNSFPGRLTASSGPGVLYSVDAQGNLYRSRYDYASQRWVEAGVKIGSGFNQFTSIFSPGGDVLYAIDGTAGAGQMYWYHFDAATQTWDDNGIGQQVGSGWFTSSNAQVFAMAGTCSAPDQAPVAPVTPQAPDPNPAIPVAGDTPGVPLHYFYLDSAGHIVSATDNGATGLSTQQIGDRTFASDVSAANADGMMVAGIDDTGQVWLSWAGSGSTFPDFVPLGGSMTAIALSGSGSAQAGHLDMYGLDGNGDLWYRYGSVAVDGTQLTAWQDVYSGHHLRGPLVAPQDAGYEAVYATAEDGSTVCIGDQGTSWEVTSVISGDEAFLGAMESGAVITYLNEGTLNVPLGDSGQQNLLLGPNQDIRVADEPVGATALGFPGEAVAAVGKDGNLYYANTLPSGSFGPWTPGGSPWTRIAGVTPANPPTLVWNQTDTADLVFRGTDGKIYHYTASTSGTPNSPLSFTGGPHS